MSLSVESRAYFDIYTLVENVSLTDAVPTGARGLIHASIDGLRQGSAPPEHIQLAERISVILHKLEWAARNGDKEDLKQLRMEFETAGAAWLQRPSLAMH